MFLVAVKLDIHSVHLGVVKVEYRTEGMFEGMHVTPTHSDLGPVTSDHFGDFGPVTPHHVFHSRSNMATVDS